jgi:hypothetical protein
MGYYGSGPRKRRLSGRPVDGERILEDAAFAATRASMQRFGMASRLSGILRKALLPRGQGFMDRGFHFRLQTKLQSILQDCMRELGLDDSMHNDDANALFRQRLCGLNGTGLRNGQALSDHFLGSFELVHAVRRAVVRVVPPEHGPVVVPIPGATHWRLVLVGRPMMRAGDSVQETGGKDAFWEGVDNAIDKIWDTCHEVHGFQVFHTITFDINVVPTWESELSLMCQEDLRGKDAPDFIVGLGIEFLRGNRAVVEGSRMELFVVLG